MENPQQVQQQEQPQEPAAPEVTGLASLVTASVPGDEDVEDELQLMQLQAMNGRVR